jgi:uncharacterized lipoprotein NlpE involved in copper resistance
MFNKAVLLFLIGVLFLVGCENKTEVNTMFKDQGKECSTLYQIRPLPSGTSLLLFRDNGVWRIVSENVESPKECPVFSENVIIDNYMIYDTSGAFISKKFIDFKKQYNCINDFYAKN